MTHSSVFCYKAQVLLAFFHKYQEVLRSPPVGLRAAQSQGKFASEAFAKVAGDVDCGAVNSTVSMKTKEYYPQDGSYSAGL